MKFFKNTTLAVTGFIKEVKGSTTEQLASKLENELNKEGIKLKTNNKFFNALAYTLGAMMFLEKKVLAAPPQTGFAELDAGAWQLVKVFQAAVFWVALLYTLKSLLLLAVKGEGEWRKVATGFLICLGDYLIPFLFGMVPGLFNF